MASLLLVRVASADVFAFTDEHGVAHYSNVPTDMRYRMVLSEPRTAAPPVHVNETVLKRAERYASIIDSAARDSSLEPALVRAVLLVESGGDPKAVSRRGALGLMQLMPETARRFGVRDSFNPEQNIRAGSHYLRELCDRYRDDLRLVLAAYNAGPATVDGHGGDIPPLKETLDYVPRVLEIYEHLRQAAADSAGPLNVAAHSLPGVSD